MQQPNDIEGEVDLDGGHIHAVPDALSCLLNNVGFASRVPYFFGDEPVENVLHVVFQQADSS